MQVRNDFIMSDPAPFSLKEGETFFATVKEKLSNDEAIITVKGQDVHVRFQGEIPKEDKVVVRIVGIKDHVLQVQAVPKAAETNGPAAGLFPAGELEKAEQILLAQGIRLSKEEKAILRRFLEKAKGTLSEKLETVQALANKKLEVTESHLQAIHEALHGDSFGETLAQLVDYLALLPSLRSSVENSLQALMGNGLQTSAEDNLQDWKENNRDFVSNGTKVFRSPAETDLMEEQEIPQKNQSAETAESQQTEWTYWNEEWMQAFPTPAKNIIVKTITEKLSQAALDFKKLQIEMNKKLENAAFLLDNGQTSARQQAKQLVEAVIRTLDRAILQGEFMLFTDMKTEKQMLQASAKLAEAKQLLIEGKQSDALKAVKEAKHLLEGLRFQPADVKVKHFVSAHPFSGEDPEAAPKQQLLPQLARILKFPLSEEVSARNTFEQFRQLGFHHEKDVFHALLSKQMAREPQNIKALLLKLSQGEFGMIAAQAEHALANMTGQQLLSKFDAGNHMQTMFYQVPVLLHDQMETVRIYLNARNDGGKLDWQNCSLYFLLDTEKYGKIGILLQALERDLTVTIKTDSEKLTEALKALTETAKENLEEIGYNVKGITFAKMNHKHEEEKTAAETRKADERNSGKGYDWKV